MTAVIANQYHFKLCIIRSKQEVVRKIDQVGAAKLAHSFRKTAWVRRGFGKHHLQVPEKTKSQNVAAFALIMSYRVIDIPLGGFMVRDNPNLLHG